MMSTVSTYAFINAKLRARISAMLDDSFYRTIARARSFVEAVGLLQPTRYAPAADAYTRTGDVKLVELELVRLEWQTLGGLRRYVPSAVLGFTDALLRQYEVAVVKHAVRLWFERALRGRPIDDKVPYLVRDEGAHGVPVDAIVNAGSAGEIAAALHDRPYGEPLGELLAAVAPDGSLFAAEIALDRWYYNQLLAAMKSLDTRDERVARALLGVQIDGQNVNWLVRIRRYHKPADVHFEDSILPGGRLIDDRELAGAYSAERPLEPLLAALGRRVPGSTLASDPGDDARGELRRLVLLERMLHLILEHEISRTLGGYPFTIGTLIAYILLLQDEVRTLISVLNAKYYDLSSERIEGLL